MTWWMHLILVIVSALNVLALNSAWGAKTFTPYMRGLNTGIWATCALINIVQLLS